MAVCVKVYQHVKLCWHRLSWVCQRWVLQNLWELLLLSLLVGSIWRYHVVDGVEQMQEPMQHDYKFLRRGSFQELFTEAWWKGNPEGSGMASLIAVEAGDLRVTSLMGWSLEPKLRRYSPTCTPCERSRSRNWCWVAVSYQLAKNKSAATASWCSCWKHCQAASLILEPGCPASPPSIVVTQQNHALCLLNKMVVHDVSVYSSSSSFSSPGGGNGGVKRMEVMVRTGQRHALLSTSHPPPRPQ